MQIAQQQLQALYVIWQDRDTREYFPVGRLIGGLAPDLPNFEFCYLNGMKRALQMFFQPLPFFGDVKRTYRADNLFPMFQNRVMSPGRPDYPEYVSNLALDPDNTDPMTILSRSGGGRATDSLEMFELPRVGQDGNSYRTYFLAHGLKPSSLARITDLQPDERLIIVLGSNGKADPSGLTLQTQDGVAVGYMPRYLIGDGLNDTELIRCYVVQANPANAPLQQRLLCRLDVSWPNNNHPFASDTYQPIPADATDLRHWAR